jgi:hypothetical protein
VPIPRFAVSISDNGRRFGVANRVTKIEHRAIVFRAHLLYNFRFDSADVAMTCVSKARSRLVSFQFSFQQFE